MRDDYYSPAWADNRKEMSMAITAAIHKLINKTAEVFELKHDQDFDAPWRRQPRRAKPTDCHTAA